jgi:signal transduction histidine kinase
LEKRLALSHSENVSALKSVQMLVYTSKMAKNLMMDLLDLAQVENNSFRVLSAPFSLLKVIEDAFLVVSHIAKEKKIKLVSP